MITDPHLVTPIKPLVFFVCYFPPVDLSPHLGLGLADDRITEEIKNLVGSMWNTVLD